MELCGSKFQLAPQHVSLIDDVANPEIVYMLLLFKYFVFTDFFFFLTLTLKESLFSI